MKDKIKNIAEKLEHQIRMHELDLNDRIKDIPQIILLLEQGFSELKEIVSFYKFKSEMDEIFFFKIIKPKFFSKLIYYRKVGAPDKPCGVGRADANPKTMLPNDT
ncbi:hypothetical protein ACTQ2R_13785 [Hallella faecis]|uniref:hypothetical protein n=1 Tax=Hallella faecis TaxID=2841596 RepID=UPI003F91280D